MVELTHATTRLWQSMQGFKPSISVDAIEFSSSSGFANQRVEIPAFGIICGAHSSGKSSLLGYIAECLHRGIMRFDFPPFFGVASGYQRGRPSLKGECEVFLTVDGQKINYTINLDEEEYQSGPAPEVAKTGKIAYPFLLDAYLMATEINLFFQDATPETLKKPAGPPEKQNRRDLDALREILGTPYDEVIYIPLATDTISPPWPYVRARRDGKWIDSYSMSHGELYVHYLRWILKHSAENIFLLDEPEAHIAPRGHAPLLDELARLARSSQAQVIMSTHSAAFLNRVPLPWVRTCVRPGMTPLVLTPSRSSDLRDTLGIENPLKSVIVVEDDTAAYTLKMILAAHQFSAMSETEVIQAGSWNDVLVTVKALSSSRRMKVAGVLDGDQRSRFDLKSATLCLPGNEPPERVFFKRALMHSEELAFALGCSSSSMNVYLTELQGLEHHRWLPILSRRTGQDWQYCLRMMFNIWHADSENRQQCETLVRNLETTLAL